MVPKSPHEMEKGEQPCDPDKPRHDEAIPVETVTFILSMHELNCIHVDRDGLACKTACHCM